jgi:hypothetical protein
MVSEKGCLLLTAEKYYLVEGQKAEKDLRFRTEYPANNTC